MQYAIINFINFVSNVEVTQDDHIFVYFQF